MIDRLKNAIDSKRDEIIQYLIHKDDYPYVCHLSYKYIYDLLKDDFEVYKCSGNYNQMYHCWNEVFVSGERVVIDFTRAQFDFSELRGGSFSDYTARMKDDFNLQKEYVITKEHHEFNKYIPIDKFI